MQLCYELSQTDFEAAQAAAQRLCRSRGLGNGTSLALNVLGWGLIGFAASALLNNQRSPEHWFQTPWVTLALFVAGLSIAFAGSLHGARRVRRAVLAPLQPFPITHSLHLTDHGIEISNRFGRSQLTWEAFQGIFELNDHIALVLKPSSVFVVPFRAFPTREERNSVVAHIRARAGL
jgi:hypothetical protein